MLRCDDPLPDRPRRLLVAGVAGAGKTTLARRIAQTTGLAYTEIDSLFHGPDWTPRTDFLRDVEELSAGDGWITEWQYAAARDLLAERADLLVWLDPPFATVTFPRVVRRTLRRRWRREVLWNGNIEPPLRTIFTDREYIVRWAVATRHKYRDRIPGLARTHPHLTVVRLRSSGETERWLAGPLRRSTEG